MKPVALLSTIIFMIGSVAMAADVQDKSTSERPAVGAVFRRVIDLASQTTPSLGQTTPEKPAATEPRPKFVRTADFYLKDGTFIYGKLVSEDKNKVTIEHIEGSKIVAATYGRRQIEPRTFQIKSVPAAKYYTELAEYFAARTWDFENDADDFIQAIRCYEAAKRAITGNSEQDRQRIKSIEEKIKELQADRQVWAREVQSRAKLRQTEFEAEYQARFSLLKNQIEANTTKLNEAIARLDKLVTNLQENHQKLEQNFAAMDQQLRGQLSILAEQIEINRSIIDPFYRASRLRYPYSRFYGRYGY